MSACHRHYPGRSDGADSLSTAPSSSAFPRLQLGRLLHYQFRGLLSVHSRYNLQTRRVALCDPLHRRLRRLCCLYRRSDCYRVERSSSRTGLHPAVAQCLSRRTVMAFHEKAGRSQVDSCLFLLGTFSSPRRVATVAMLPSALSRSDSFRSVHVGRSRFSRCCHLFGALWFCSRRVEPGPGH